MPHATAARWAARCRPQGRAGMTDRSSQPHHGPARTTRRTERRIIRVRVTTRIGPARIAARLGLNAPTVRRVLTRYGPAPDPPRQRHRCVSWPQRARPTRRPDPRRRENPTAAATASSDAHKADATSAPPPRARTAER
ncbi:hypothetical protein FL583_14585 [Cryptosporangium phraense]|uniref:Uncharacterized protein n=1 Tax=Cryptosporangium phraense TaxID=2593070 RepID=A0A545AS78_9ACTN|nr:hypothetical protein FL583_14585 [Cryptosporangium phraense]